MDPFPDGGGAQSGTGGAGGCRVENVDEKKCGQLIAVVRDFTDKHPDMESILGDNCPFTEIVRPVLGADQKPQYQPAGSTSMTTGPAAFDQWYRDVPTVNQRMEIPIPLTLGSCNVTSNSCPCLLDTRCNCVANCQSASSCLYVYENLNFFPWDGKGFGNQGRIHNYHFTTEIHSKFTYNGGEKFTFIGDDDVFVFVNGKLALNLGGVHNTVCGTIDFDAQSAALGIKVGNFYDLDIFHAERHTSKSTFRIETTIPCLQPKVIP